MNNIYTFIAIAVYLVTVAVVCHVRRKRFTDDTYRLMLSSRDYTSFVDAITAISKALDTEPEPEPEQTELNEGKTE